MKRLPLLRQLAELGFWSTNLRTLRKHWTDTLVSDTPGDSAPGRRHIRSYAVLGTRPPGFFKVVVPHMSARGFDIDGEIELRSDLAFGLGHGVDAMKDCRQRIEQILSDHDYARSEELLAHLATVPVTVLGDELKAHVPSAALACEVDCWRRRITQGFRLKPLRCLAAAQTLSKLIRLRLPHP